MGFFDFLRRPATSGSSGLFNQANKHWKLRQAALLSGDDTKQLQELLEVIRYCQQAITANRKEGNAYVLLTNVLLSASLEPRLDEEARRLLTQYAMAVIHRWWTLPQKEYPFTTKNNYQLGVRFYQEVMEELQRTEGCSKREAEAKMANYAAQYGDLATSANSYEQVREAVSCPDRATSRKTDSLPEQPAKADEVCPDEASAKAVPKEQKPELTAIDEKAIPFNKGVDMEDFEKALANFYKAAEACGVSAGDAMNEVADSAGAADKMTPLYSDKIEQLANLTQNFLQEYATKVLKRFVFVDQRADSRDYDGVERTWREYYEPMWLAGCNFWIEFRRKRFKEKRVAPFLSKVGSVTDHDRQALNQYFDNLGEAAVKAQRAQLTKFQPILQQSVHRTIKEMRKYDRR